MNNTETKVKGMVHSQNKKQTDMHPTILVMILKLGGVAYAWDHSTWEAKAGQLRLQAEILSPQQ